MNEASKTRRLWTADEKAIFEGDGIDIGCGPDPISPRAVRFDLAEGDANRIGDFVQRRFDYVFSAHCLEHMKEPARALAGWWELVRPGGHLVVVVPDEDLYEQGYWPSVFNTDHKSTFTIAKQESWSARSYNVRDLVENLPESEVVSIRLQDVGFDRRLSQGAIYPRLIARILARAYRLSISIARKIGLGNLVKEAARILRIPVDQTQFQAVAQIQAIVRKCPDSSSTEMLGLAACH